LAYYPTRGSLGVAIVVLVCAHAIVAQHLWWSFAAPLIAGIAAAVVASQVHADDVVLPAGIAAAAVAALYFVGGIAFWRKHRWLIWRKERTEDQIKRFRHQSGRFNLAIAFQELPFVITLEVFLIAYVTAGCYMAISDAMIATAVVSAILLVALALKTITGAQAWPSLPSEVYWIFIIAFAFASGFGWHPHGVMPIVTAVAAAFAIMFCWYRAWALLYPLIAATMAGIASRMMMSFFFHPLMFHSHRWNSQRLLVRGPRCGLWRSGWCFPSRPRSCECQVASFRLP
jgi:hypothetical protein